MPTVGLTGGIGSGKSAVADSLAALGAIIVDTDLISREMTASGGGAIDALVNTFGPAVLAADGGLDRAAMRQRVFSSPDERLRLEAVLHPRIREESTRRLENARGPYAVLVVPLLFESGTWARRVGRVVVVDCPESLQVARTVARSGLSEAEVRAIMAAQWPRWRRLQAADDVLWNGGSREALQAQVAALDRRIRRD
ncbi:MAG: dephospho-CoA kinase [Betaproteobacteria bacterium]|nr:dephospho-CoA kinase [Betaproteobacteria bacterium]